MKNLLNLILYLWTKSWVGIVITIILIIVVLNGLGLDCCEPSSPKFFTGQD